EVIDLLAGYARKYDVWLEYGLQTMHAESLARINRGHTLEEFVAAVRLAAGRGIRLCVHVIIGLPWEGREMVFATAEFLAGLPLDGIKIHSLLLLAGTPLHADYQASPFSLLSRDEYVFRVAGFLERLPPQVVVQRLTAEGYRDIFVAPDWARNKLQVLQHLDRFQREHGSFQGRLWTAERKDT
ncbi:MAG: TIGR01212 family radical SAM protein, partial [Deltaproteobacteria bacterium]|nr:TIGR01212 family radical SAM protein [Deltaproteobacteria bacterium]